jgi:hypothetical protein
MNRIYHSNKYTVNDVVVTNDGKVGNLLWWQPMNFSGGPQLVFITDIPNVKTDNTGYLKDEIEIIPKEFFETLNKHLR